jgi:hypothetical protein
MLHTMLHTSEGHSMDMSSDCSSKQKFRASRGFGKAMIKASA